MFSLIQDARVYNFLGFSICYALLLELIFIQSMKKDSTDEAYSL